MRIVVGSRNPAKVEAVRDVMKDYPRLAAAEVVGTEVASGVSDQPKSLDDTVAGAIARAKGAFADCDYAVGIESGFMAVPQARTGYLEFSVAAIWDGDRAHLGFSPAFECPDEVMRLVLEEGCDLSTACFRAGVASDPEIGRKQGIIGVLTKGRMTRKDYTTYALRLALIHLDRP